MGWNKIIKVVAGCIILGAGAIFAFGAGAEATKAPTAGELKQPDVLRNCLIRTKDKKNCLDYGENDFAYLLYYNPQYKEVCNLMGSFLEAQNVPHTDQKVDFLPFSYDIPAPTYFNKDRQEMYGAFECCEGGSMGSYLLVDIDNDGKKEVVEKSSGSVGSSNTSIDQSIYFGTWLEKTDPDYDVVTQYIYDLMMRAVEMKKMQYRERIYDNLKPFEEFLQQEYAKVAESSLRDAAKDKARNLIIRFQEITEEKKADFGQKRTFIPSNFRVQRFYPQKLDLDEAKFNDPEIDKYELNKPIYNRFGAIELLSFRDEVYLIAVSDVTINPSMIVQYYIDNNLPVNDMSYIKLVKTGNRWKDTYNMKSDLRILRGGEAGFKPICRFIYENSDYKTKTYEVN